MIRKEEFSRRRTPDVYTRRNGKLEKLNEKKPTSELVERMDCIIDRLDKITGAVEKLVDNCNIEIHTDFDELNQKISEKYNNKESDKGEAIDDNDKNMSNSGDNKRLDGLFGTLDAALRVDYESLFDNDYLLDLKRTLISALTKEHDKKIMDELSSKDSVNNKPKHSDDLDTSSLQLNNLLFEKDCISETMKRMCPPTSDDDSDLYRKIRLFLNEIWSNKTTDETPKKTIFCILGETGSGKDSLVNYTLKKYNLDLKPVLSYTDRPIREGEQDGKEHVFLSKEEMDKFLYGNRKEIAAYTKIGENGYRYCTITSIVDKSDIYIIDPNGLTEFKERTEGRYNIVSIYIDCPYTERRKRTEKRGDDVLIFEARVFNESEQFAEFREDHIYDYIIDNGDLTTMDEAAQRLVKIFKK